MDLSLQWNHFFKNFFFWWSSNFFSFELPNNNLPKTIHAISTTWHPLTKTPNKSKRHINLVRNFLSFKTLVSTSQITISKIYWYRQDFSIACSNFILWSHKISPYISLRLQISSTYVLKTSPHPNSKAHFKSLTAPRRSNENFSVPGATQENLESTLPPRTTD